MLEVYFNLWSLAAYIALIWTSDPAWICRLPAATPNTFTAAVDHGWTMMASGCVKNSQNNKGHLPSTCVYKFLSPPVHQVCVFSLGCHWKVCPIKDATRAGQSSKKTQQFSSFVSLASTEQIFSCHWGPTFFFSFEIGAGQTGTS